MVRKHYAACITHADSLIGQLLGKLEKLGLRKRTAVILWGIMVGISESMRFGESMPSSRIPAVSSDHLLPWNPQSGCPQ